MSFLLLVQNPETKKWMITCDTEDRDEAQKEYNGRKDSDIIFLDTTDYVTIA